MDDEVVQKQRKARQALEDAVAECLDAGLAPEDVIETVDDAISNHETE